MIKEALLAFTLSATGELHWKDKEHSGAAFDSNGLLYTVPDSGGGSVVYTGQARWKISPRNRDWEDLDIFYCLNIPNKECFYIADTGMNATGKRHLTVYEVGFNSENYHKHVFEYTDYNADTEAFDIHNGEMYFIKKDGTRKLYKAKNGKARLCGILDSGGVYVTGMSMIDNKLAITYHKGKDYFIKEYELRGCKVIRSKRIDWTTRKQLEAIAYNNHDILTAITEDGSIFYFEREAQ